MKAIILVATLLICGVASYKVHKIAAHNAYIQGCSSAASSILSMVGVPTTPELIASACSTIAAEEGY